MSSYRMHLGSQVKRQYAKKEEIYQELKSSGGGVAELSRESIQK